MPTTSGSQLTACSICCISSRKRPMASPTVSSSEAAPGRSRILLNTLAVSSDFIVKRCRTSVHAPSSMNTNRPRVTPINTASREFKLNPALPPPIRVSKYSRTTSPVASGAIRTAIHSNRLTK